MTSAMPNKALSPSWGKSVGGVDERAGAKAGGSNLSATQIPSRVVAAKGIPVFRKAARFAVCRWNEGLGRLVIGASGFLRGY
jgi:hypothetical protein